jgi:hypothetical protein
MPFITSQEIAIATTTIAVGGTLLGVFLQGRSDRRRREQELEQERKRWEREDRLERDRWSREDTAKWADERRNIYARYFALTDELKQCVSSYLRSTSRRSEPSADNRLLVRKNLAQSHEEALANLQLVMSDQAEKAIDDLHMNVVTQVIIAIVHSKAVRQGNQVMEHWIPDLIEHDESYKELRRIAVDAAKRDLGTA